MRILFRNYNVSQSTKQQLLIAFAVFVSVTSVLGFIIWFASFSADPAIGAPSPSPEFNAFKNAVTEGSIQGASTQQIPPPNPQGPDAPTPKPSPSPSPSTSISPSPSPSPSKTPEPSPSPSPSKTPDPTPNPTHNNTPTPTPTPTPLPSKPSNLAGDSSCNGSSAKVVLTWNSSDNTQSYKLYRDGSVVSSGSSNTNYTDNGVSQNHSYLYFVRSVNQTGESPDSDSVTVSTSNCP